MCVGWKLSVQTSPRVMLRVAGFWNLVNVSWIRVIKSVSCLRGDHRFTQLKSPLLFYIMVLFCFALFACVQNARFTVDAPELWSASCRGSVVEVVLGLSSLCVQLWLCVSGWLTCILMVTFISLLQCSHAPGLQTSVLLALHTHTHSCNHLE